MGQKRMEDIFGDKWLGKYTVGWCESCRTAYILCPKCDNTSCNGSGCEECATDKLKLKEFKTRVEDYLTEEERKIYEKTERLKRFITMNIQAGENKIDFKTLQKAGKLSQKDEEIFKKEIWQNQ